MDPLSILGAVAAASQLFEQGLKITSFLYELYGKAKEAPESIQKQTVKVEQLIDLALLVKENPSLQTEAVASILRTCLRTAEQFQKTLKKVSIADEDGKWKKAGKVASALFKDKEIIQYFDEIEKEKTSLVLCIQEIDSRLLHSIETRIQQVKTDTGEISRVVHHTADVVNTLPEISERVIDIHTMMQNMKLVRENSLRDAATRPEPDTEVKTYYMVPNRRIQGFVGREDVLIKVKAGFESGPGPRIVVIRAMGGQGKTQLALGYCRRSKNSLFKGIFWAAATSENTLKKSFETIAESIKVPGKIFQEGGRVEFVIEELERWSDSWFIVFDNYDDPGLFNVGEYFPQGESGCILVTTRHAEAESLAESENAIELLGLNQEPALELLYNQSRIKQTDDNIDDGKAIINRLGYHPLAISQAGSYIKLRKIQLHEFMAYYKLKRKDILKQTHQMTQYRRKLNDTEKETALSVFTTWELSFQLIQDKDEGGKHKTDLLTLFAFFNGKDISEQLFKSFCGIPKCPG